MNLTEQAQEVAEWRARVAGLQATAKKLEAEFRQQYVVLYTDLARSEDALKTTEAALRTEIVAQFKATGNKHPAAGLGIREIVELNYLESDALEWAKEHAMCLTLDKKAFEKVVKAINGALPFVVQETVPTATIATDLSMYMEQASGPQDHLEREAE